MDRISDPGRDMCVRHSTIESATDANTAKLEELRSLLSELYKVIEQQIVATRLNTMNAKRAALATEQLSAEVEKLKTDMRELREEIKQQCELQEVLKESNSAVVRLADVISAHQQTSEGMIDALKDLS